MKGISVYIRRVAFPLYDVHDTFWRGLLTIGVHQPPTRFNDDPHIIKLGRAKHLIMVIGKGYHTP